jgi:DNA-directed RNA polymerase specialized sigma24 family protein
MKTINVNLATLDIQDHETDAEIQDEFDDLVRRGCEGDRRAIGAIAIAIGPKLLHEARGELGDFGQDGTDVLQDFWLAMLEKRLRYSPAHGRAMPFMCGMVRAIAQQRRREYERDWDSDAENE